MFGVKCGSGFVFPQTAFQLSQCWSLTLPSLPQSLVPEEFIPHLSWLTADFQLPRLPAAPQQVRAGGAHVAGLVSSLGSRCMWPRVVPACWSLLEPPSHWCLPDPSPSCSWGSAFLSCCLTSLCFVPCSCFSLPSFHLVPPARSRPCWQRTDSLLTE